MLDHLSKPFDSDDLVRMVLRHSRRAPEITTPMRDESAAAHAAEAPPMPTPALVDAPDAPAAPASAGIPTLDLDGALRRCGNQSGLLRTLITRFCQDQADFSERFETAQHEDLERARQLAHRLKGTAGNLGLPGLAAQASELEEACATGHVARLQAGLTSLRDSMQQHQSALKAWLAQEPLPA